MTHSKTEKVEPVFSTKLQFSMSESEVLFALYAFQDNMCAWYLL